MVGGFGDTMANQLKDQNCVNTPTTANFEYDDNEWDIGIGNLIIDLDADIEKTRVGEGMAAPKQDAMQDHQFDQKSTVNKGLKMKIKRAKPGTKHEIVKSGYNGDKHPSTSSNSGSGSSKKSTVSHRKDKKMDKCTCHSKGDGHRGACATCHTLPILTCEQTRPSEKEKELLQQSLSTLELSPNPLCPEPSLPTLIESSATEEIKDSQDNSSSIEYLGYQPVGQDLNHRKSSIDSEENLECCLKPKAKESKASIPVSDCYQKPKSYVDSCVGTTVATTTEPSFLGHCEPGTSVNLEGIVWHETEGILVVNVTWRGKTYVGSLLDCSRLEWDYPSSTPASDLDLRSSKVRTKRARIGANNLAVFTSYNEARSSGQGKPRSGNLSTELANKGRRAGSFAHPNSNPGKAEVSSGKRKSKGQEEETASKHRALTQTQYPKTPLSSPVFFECPQPNCSKKYKHINGLKYHQSHAHGSIEDEETKDSEISEEEPVIPQLSIQENKPEIDLALKPPELVSVSMPIEEQPSNFSSSDNSTPGSSGLSRPIPSPTIPTLPLTESPKPSTFATTSPKVMKLKLKSSPVLLCETTEVATLSDQSKGNNKKKNRRSPPKSPNLSPSEPPVLGEEMPREDVQSPAYSDISEEAAPVLELEAKATDIRPKSTSNLDRSHSPPMSQYGLYSYYTQSPYVLPAMSKKTDAPGPMKADTSRNDKQDFQKDNTQKGGTKGFFQYRYQLPGSPFNSETCSGILDGQKPNSSPEDNSNSAEPLNIATPNKGKSDLEASGPETSEDASQGQKELVPFKNPPSAGFARPKEPEEEGKRYFTYERSETATTHSITHSGVSSSKAAVSSPPIKDKVTCRDEVGSQDSLKTTMETQCSPIHSQSSQYTYIHTGYMQPPHYSTLPFDPSLPVYRGINPMIVPSYPNSPYVQHPLHSLPRYHVPEDLSRTPSGKPMELLHHSNQYYSHSSPHKIHELQERAVKSPTQPSAITSTTATVLPTTTSQSTTASSSTSAKQPLNFECTKDARSPPPQRHVHTHHHTHVGLGYPPLLSQYPPYGGKL